MLTINSDRIQFRYNFNENSTKIENIKTILLAYLKGDDECR